MHVQLGQRLLVAFVLASVLVAAGSGISSIPVVLAQEPGLDLAAMALEQRDLPVGYSQQGFDYEGYTPGHRIAAIQFGGQVPASELESLNLVQFYSSTFFTDDESSSIYIYLTEYESEEAVQAGFDFFENEENPDFPPGESEDQAGPTAGDTPKEITISSDNQASPPVQFIDATFRVDRILAGVSLTSESSTADTSEVETLAATLADRISTVLGGRSPGGCRFRASRSVAETL